jgi:hypothetical protein
VAHAGPYVDLFMKKFTLKTNHSLLSIVLYD